MQKPPHQTERARNLRRNQTEPEKRLWSRLRNRQLGGIKFRRQTAVGPYIMDFAALEVGLVIEVDGDTHAFTEESDARRSTFLEREGLQVIRFGNAEVMTNIEGVLEDIMAVARNCPSPSQAYGLGPSLSQRERGK
ncbi:MAG: DUF559 domain-containing protein [Sphingobium sp.]